MNRLSRSAVFALGLLAAGCVKEPEKNYTISVTPGLTGPRIAYPETRGLGRPAKVEFKGKFRDGEQETLLTLIRAQGWKVTETTSVGNGLLEPIERSPEPITRESIEQTPDAREEGQQEAADTQENPQ